MVYIVLIKRIAFTPIQQLHASRITSSAYTE